MIKREFADCSKRYSSIAATHFVVGEIYNPLTLSQAKQTLPKPSRSNKTARINQIKSPIWINAMTQSINSELQRIKQNTQVDWDAPDISDQPLAIPLRKGQLSCREIMNGERLTVDIKPDQALTIRHIDGPYAENPVLLRFIEDRGA